MKCADGRMIHDDCFSFVTPGFLLLILISSQICFNNEALSNKNDSALSGHINNMFSTSFWILNRYRCRTHIYYMTALHTSVLF